MASTSIVEATNSPLGIEPVSLGIQDEADRSLEEEAAVPAASVGEGSSYKNSFQFEKLPKINKKFSAITLGVTRLSAASAAASPTPRGIMLTFEKCQKICKFGCGAKKCNNNNKDCCF